MNDIETQVHPEVTILDDAAIVALVVEKHNRFINDFNDELAGVGEKMNTIRSDFSLITKELESLETRISVLKEKRHQLYHQAGKLYSRYLDGQKDGEKKHQIEIEINRRQNRLQNASLSMEEELNAIDWIKAIVNEHFNGTDDQKLISSIIDVLDMAKLSRSELEDLKSSPEKYKKESKSMKDEIDDLESRQRWLEQRVKLHRDALDYWQNVKVDHE